MFRVSIVAGKHDAESLAILLEQHAKLKGNDHEIEVSFNILSIITTSNMKKRHVINQLKTGGYNDNEYYSKKKEVTDTFVVPYEFSAMKQTFPQFMANCYKPELIKKDVNITFREEDTTRTYNFTAKMFEEMSRSDKMEKTNKLLFNDEVSSSLTTNFNRNYRGAFHYLDNVFLSECGQR